MWNVQSYDSKRMPYYFFTEKVGVLLDLSASLRFVSLPALRTLKLSAIFQAMHNVRRAPTSTVLAKSCTEAIMCVSQIVTSAAVEKEM